jgi:hypothetical protein
MQPWDDRVAGTALADIQKSVAGVTPSLLRLRPFAPHCAGLFLVGIGRAASRDTHSSARLAGAYIPTIARAGFA